MNGAEFTAQIARAMSEAQLSEHVRRVCVHLRLLHYHTHSSRFSQSGYPDWHIVGPTSSIYRELKTEKGRLSVDQTLWIEGLRRAGYDAEVWRPSQWFDGQIVAELTELPRGFPDGPGRVNTRATAGAQDRASLHDSRAGTDRAASADGPGTVGGA